jgi:hypothetical protein
MDSPIWIAVLLAEFQHLGAYSAHFLLWQHNLNRHQTVIILQYTAVTIFFENKAPPRIMSQDIPQFGINLA